MLSDGEPASLPGEEALRAAYASFTETDRRTELAVADLPQPPGAIPSDFAYRWASVPFWRFADWAWRMRVLPAASEAARVTGSLTTGLYVLRALESAGLVRVAADGSLHWPAGDGQRAARMSQARDTVRRLLSPVTVGNFGQCAVDADSSYRRAVKIVADLPERGTVIFLGDCDLASLVTASGVPNPVIALERDEDALAKLEAGAAELELANLRVVPHDLTRELPAELMGCARTGVLDPVDSGHGLDLWLSRLFEALSGAEGDRCYISISIERIGRRFLALTRYLAERGFAAAEVHRDFHSWPLPHEQDDPHVTALGPAISSLGVDPEAIFSARIYTDLLVYVRHVVDWPFLPQNLVDVRRGI